MRSLLRRASAAIAFIIIPTAFPAAAQEQVGQATLIRTAVSGGSGPLSVRSPVYRDERIRTSRSGLGEFTFRDGTKFAVGGNSSVVIDRFVYDGSKTFNKLTLSAARGSFRWISGKSRSDAYQIVTPAGTIGIRGTRFDVFVGPGGVTAVVLLSGSATFCGSNGCRELKRRCDVVVATPGGGVSDPARVDPAIFQTVGTDAAFPFLSGRQQLSRSFYGGGSASCGLSKSSPSKESGNQGARNAQRSQSSPSGPDPGEGCEGGSQRASRD
ncbi:FecR domain-containing protein [Mesorhizobium sp. YM1C-6-2]|uniref:FecR family protein n=1 Tax=Mesorhizobium sp. YM1C-6-2 TaxID=1827501 RepID=UPI000EF1788E|nr:FecR domain-containing protein [Mesorhizobium sp. YM1C-6-2]RLP24209.1 hypothetical protein D8676_16100 [Mesorhizobium sp. YM1C-6-2]